MPMLRFDVSSRVDHFNRCCFILSVLLMRRHFTTFYFVIKKITLFIRVNTKFCWVYTCILSWKSRMDNFVWNTRKLSRKIDEITNIKDIVECSWRDSTCVCYTFFMWLVANYLLRECMKEWLVIFTILKVLKLKRTIFFIVIITLFPEILKSR